LRIYSLLLWLKLIQVNIPLYVYNLIIFCIFCMLFLFCRFMNGVVFLSHDHVFLQAICSSLHVCTFSHYLLLFSPRFMMYFSNIQLHVSYCGIYNRLISSSGMEINHFFFFFLTPELSFPHLLVGTPSSYRCAKAHVCIVGMRRVI